MKENHSIDQWLRKSAEQDAPGNPEALWESIAPSLPTKSNKRVLAWWLGAAALTMGMGVFILLQQKTPSSLTDKELKNSGQMVLKDAPQSSDFQENSEIRSDKNAVKPKENIEPSNDFQQTQKQALQSKELSNNSSQSKGLNNRSEGKINDDTNMAIKDRSAKELSTDVHLVDHKKAKEEFIDFESAARVPKSNYSQLFATWPNPLSESHITFGDSKDKSINVPSSWTFGLNAGINPSFIASSIQNGFSQYVHQDYLKIRSNGESALFTGGFEVFVRKHFNQFFIETGLSKYQRGFNQNYNYAIDLIPIINALPGTIPDANGRYPIDDQTPYIKDPNPEVITYQNKVNISVTEIPLRMGYQWNLGNFKIGPSLGVGYMFSNQNQAQTIDYQTLKLVDYNELFTQLDQSGWNAYTSLNIERAITKQLYIQAQTYYQRQLGTSSQVINTRNIAYGINLGINFKIAAK